MHYRYLLLVSVISLFLLSVSVQAPSYQSCSDTDGGRDYSTHGTTTGTYAGAGSVQNIYTDYCTTIYISGDVANNLTGHEREGRTSYCEGADCYVHEYYCTGPSATQDYDIYSTREPCQYGCKEGACLPAPQEASNETTPTTPSNTTGGGSGSSCPDAVKPECKEGEEVVAAFDSKGCVTDYKCSPTTSSGGGSGTSTCPEWKIPECSSKEKVEKYEDRSGCVVYKCVPNEYVCPEIGEKDKRACVARGGEPYVATDSNGCNVLKCKSDSNQTRSICPDPRKEEVYKKCVENGLEIHRSEVIYEDGSVCPVYECRERALCRKEIPEDFEKKCESQNGKVSVKKDDKSCVVDLRCLLPEERKEIKKEDIKSIPDETVLISVVSKLVDIEVIFDQLADKMKNVADYYKSAGNSNKYKRFSDVASVLEEAKSRISQIKQKLRENLDNLTVDTMRELKQLIVDLKKLTLRKILRLMLSEDDSDKPKDIRCSWEPGACEAIVEDGYFLNSDSGKCELYSGSGCSDPPFKTMRECISSCVKEVPDNE